ncbi:MAG: hypothetical protein FJ137_06505 [Deltaproteobacteria bacterium]|nr:hypothetical protein [Deltaproteobacteria bacterium]
MTAVDPVSAADFSSPAASAAGQPAAAARTPRDLPARARARLRSTRAVLAERARRLIARLPVGPVDAALDRVGLMRKARLASAMNPPSSTTSAPAAATP